MVNKITTPPTTSELIGKVNEIIDDKQDTLVSGTNIKTINNTSILGSGNIDIQGGGGSYTAGTGIDITNDVISVTSAISSGASAGSTAVQPADLSTYVTTNTAQDITARKTFFGEKAIYFKQNTSSDKLGFTLYNNSSKEVGALEFRPNSINGTPILTLNSSSPNSASYVGFRYWSYSLNIIAPFSTSLRSKNFFIPVTFTNGTTTVESTSTDGSVDISSLLPTKTSDLTNDSGYITSSALTPYVLSSSLATVATSGSYNDLTNKPDLTTKADVDLSNINPTQTVKNTIVGWGMPDYNSKVTIATTTYEAPSDGYVWYRNNNIQAMTVTVGGIEWYTGTVSGTAGTAIFPISKGETSVASTLSGVVAYFIPLKGVS